jgi:hypothetical protein
MGQDRHVAGDQQVEEEILELHRGDVMRGLDQHVARVGERQQAAGSEAGREVRHHVDVGAGDELERDILPRKGQLQCLRCLANLGAAILVEPRQNVRRAGHDGDTVSRRQARHVQRRTKIPRTVVDARQQMAMQVYHAPSAPTLACASSGNNMVTSR